MHVSLTMKTVEVNHSQRNNGGSSIVASGQDSDNDRRDSGAHRVESTKFERGSEDAGGENDSGLSFAREALELLKRRAEREVRARPLVMIGAAFGAGILIAGSVRSKTARMALVGVASHYVRKVIGLL